MFLTKLRNMNSEETFNYSVEIHTEYSVQNFKHV